MQTPGMQFPAAPAFNPMNIGQLGMGILQAASRTNPAQSGGAAAARTPPIGGLLSTFLNRLRGPGAAPTSPGGAVPMAPGGIDPLAASPASPAPNVLTGLW